MKHPNKMRLMFCLALLLVFIKKGYPQSQVLKNTARSGVASYIDQDVIRHKWEMNVNLGFPLKLSTPDWSYSYLVKRNIGKGNKTGALRFSLSPYINRFSQTFYPGGIFDHNTKSISFIPYVVLGYERQKISGRFVFYYGVDLGWRPEFINGRDGNAIKNNDDGATVQGNLVTKAVKNVGWAAPLIGGKYYINHRFSLSLEGQLRPIFSKYNSTSKFEGVLVEKEISKGIDISATGSYALNISYNF